MPAIQIVSIAASILCPLITALVMWGYKSDQTAMKNSIQQITEKSAEGIAKNAASIEKVEARQAERMDRLEANFNDLKSEMPMVFVMREEFVRTLNNVESRVIGVDGKLDRILEKMAKVGSGNG